MFKDRNVLVTGGTGLIGRPLVEMLIERGAKVRVVSLDDPSRAHPQAEFIKADLMFLDKCLEVCKGMDYVFHLAGIKGSPAVTVKKPASFFVPTLSFSVNMMEAARRQGVKKYLFTSSVGVYSPAEVFFEDDVWKTVPSQNDWFAGWAKRMAELQADAYRIEYGWNGVSIVRPANVYGPYDNFDPENAMVIPSLIRRAMDGEDPFVIWGDGSAIRDFIHAKDVAHGMIRVVEEGYTQPVNLGSGVGVAIRDIVEIIVKNLGENLGSKPKVVWDTSKPSGDKKRILDTARAQSLGISSRISLEEGIKETMAWYGANRSVVGQRFMSLDSKRKVLVCGATGFIGRNLAESLAARDDFDVTGVYLKTHPVEHPKIRMIRADLTRADDVKRALSGMDIVVQAAATTSGAKDIVNRPYLHVTDNAVMNSLIFRSAYELKISHLVFFSCSVMYPSSLDRPVKEGDFNGEIYPNYFGVGWTKVYVEKMAEFYSRLGATKYSILRHSNIYGPHDKYDLERSHVFGATVTKVMKASDGKITVWGDGTEERDFLYVDDLMDYVHRAIDGQKTAFDLSNVGCGSSVSVSDLIHKIISASGKDVRIEYDRSKPTIKTKLCLDITRARENLGWVPKTSLDEGIKKTLDWYQRIYG